MYLRRAFRYSALAAALATPAVGLADIDILYLSYSAGGMSVLNDLFGADTRFELGTSAVRTDLPTVAEMLDFDRVLVATNGTPPAGLGDRLADYVDAGGVVVLATFSGFHDFGGRINTAGYSPLTGGTTDAYSARTLGAYNASSPIMDGVSSLGANQYSGDWTGVDSTATLHASWNDGRPLVATNASGTVAAISLFPDVVDYGHASGDYRRLFGNTLANVVPEPASLIAFGIGAAALLLKRKSHVSYESSRSGGRFSSRRSVL